MDKITLNRLMLLHPIWRDAVIDIWEKEVLKVLTGRAYCRVTHTRRTFEEQDVLYAQGRTRLHDAHGNRLGIVTYAQGGYSWHNYGLAFDIVLIVDDKTASYKTSLDYDGDGMADWMEVADIFKRHGIEWGGDWAKPKTDAPHFQTKCGLAIEDARRKYLAKQFIDGTKYIRV